VKHGLLGVCQSWWDFCVYNSHTACQLLPDYGKLRSALQRKQAQALVHAIPLDGFYDQRHDFMMQLNEENSVLVSALMTEPLVCVKWRPIGPGRPVASPVLLIDRLHIPPIKWSTLGLTPRSCA
jgi:hypothetical protein